MNRTESWGSLLILLLHVSLGFSDRSVKLRYEAVGEGIAGWRPAGSEGHAVDREVSLDGKPSLMIFRTPANQGSLPFGCRWVSEPIPVIPGQPYTVCAQIRVAGLQKGRVGFRVNFYGDAEIAASGAYTQGSEFGDVIYTDTEWTFAGFSFRVPEGASHAVVWLTAEKDFLGTVWFNQVHLFSGDSLPISEVKTEPTLDGDLEESVWKQGLVCTHFHPVQQTTLEVETRVILLISGDDLFLGAFCREPDIEDLKQGSTRNHRPEIWMDDSIELVVAPDPQTLRALKFVINTLGKYSIFESDGAMVKNGPEVEAAVKRGRDSWTLEVRIPLAYLLKTAKTGADFNELAERERLSRFLHVGLNRNRLAGTRSYLSWGPEQQYHNDSHERLVPVFRASGIVPITANLDHWKWFEKRPGGGGFEGIREPKAHIVKDPLYTELFSATPRALPRDVGFIWRPLYDWADAFALTFGVPYDRDRFADQIKQAGMHCFEYFWGSLEDCPRYGTKPELVDYLDGRGVKRVYYAAYHSPPGAQGKFPVLKKEWGYSQRYTAWVFDPDVEKLAIADLERVIRANKDRLRGVCIGDECIMAYMNFGPDFFGALKTHPEEFKYPFIEDAAREIKAKYGFGKFGPPQGMGDKNPFRWIAYHKWFLQTYARVARNFRDTAKSLDPDVLVISSEDPAYPFGRSRLAPFFDVVAEEMGPDRIPTADSFRSSFSTKRAVDVCRPTPVWPVDHFENQFTANEVLALYSENLRAGAEGSISWAPRGVCKRPGDVSRRSKTDVWTLNEYYAHPDTWNARFYAWEHMRDMPRLKHPKPDCAILQSIITADTAYKWTGLNLDIQEAGYTLLGPRAGVWFEFVEDLQVLDGKKKLTDYKVVFVPHAKYGTRMMAERFKAFVQQGGTLVAFDPEMFAFFDDGETGSAFLADLAGVMVGDTNEKAFGGLKFRFTKEGAPLFGQSEGGIIEIAEPENAFLVKPASDVRVLAVDPEDNPLILEKVTGKGRCIYFAANPCIKEITKDRKWITLFTNFAANLGLRTGQDIWRFQLPLLPEKERREPDLTCLTGNHFQLWMYQYFEDHNAVTDGMGYRYSRAPDAVPDQGGGAGTWIPLADGDLTDRRRTLSMDYESLLKPIIDRWRVIQYKKGSPLPEDAWQVAYNPGPGFDVTFDLKHACAIQGIRIVYQGYRPAITAEVSQDAMNWRTAGSAEKDMVTHVAEERFEWPTASGRYLKLSFADIEKRLSLAEIEVWGKGDWVKLDLPGSAPAAEAKRAPAPTLNLGQEANLLLNADFETVYEPASAKRISLVEKRGWAMEGKLLPENWNVNFHGRQACYIKVDEADPHSGKYCLKVRGTAGEPVDMVLSEHVPISRAPLKLRARIWARGKGAFYAGVFAYGHRKGTGWDRTRSPLLLTPEWQEFTVELNLLNPETVKISFYLQPAKDAEPPKVWFDDLSLEVVAW